MTPLKYPFAPLAGVMGMSESQAAKQLGVSGRVEQEYRRDGMSEKVADRLATRAGFHPSLIWPDWFDNTIAAASKPCVECGLPFVPWRAGIRFCSKACSQRRWKRERYATDPDYAEAQRARARAYHHECKDYELADHRRWREANQARIAASRRAYYLANHERELARQREYHRRRRAAA